MKYFLKYRALFILISQVVGATICLYFIIQVNTYEITWNFLLFLLPTTFVNSINNLLQSVGTSILIIPLTIIVISLLFPENLKFKLMSTFFGVSSTLLVLTSGFLKGSVFETYNLRIFLVTKILTLEEKQFIFKEEYLKIVEEKYKTKLELYNFLQEKILFKYWDIYNQKLQALKETVAIKLYASDTVATLTELFLHEEQSKLKQTIVQTTNYLNKNIITGTVAFIGVLLVFAGVFYLFADKLEEGAKAMLEAAKLSKMCTEHTQETETIMALFMERFKALLPDLIKTADFKNLIIDLILKEEMYKDIQKKLFTNMLERILNLESRMNNAIGGGN